MFVMVNPPHTTRAHTHVHSLLLNSSLFVCTVIWEPIILPNHKLSAYSVHRVSGCPSPERLPVCPVRSVNTSHFRDNRSVPTARTAQRMRRSDNRNAVRGKSCVALPAA